MSYDERVAEFLGRFLAGNNVWLALLATFVGGLLTSMTPCVYPLIPITIRYFAGSKQSRRLRVVMRALVYVGGMVVLYATLGTVFASMKFVFGFLLGSRVLLVALAVLCFAMGLSLLGAFSLQLPSGINTRVARLGGDNIVGALLMGLVSGLIAAPCTGPVLAVILTAIAFSGDVQLGFLLMVAFGLGLGTPFLVLALSAGALARLPVSPRLSEAVKAVLAVAMLVVSTYYLQLACPRVGEALRLVPLLSVVGVGLLGTALGLFSLREVRRSRGTVLRIVAIVLLTGAAAAGVEHRARRQTSDASVAPPIAWMTADVEALAVAKASRRPVMIDFTAEWCQACKQLERETYQDPEVRAAARRFIAVKIDATRMDDQVQTTIDRYGVIGLPTMVFVDSAGVVLQDPRVTGYVSAPRLVTLLERVH